MQPANTKLLTLCVNYHSLLETEAFSPLTEEPSLQGVPLNSSAILLSWNNTSDTPTLGYFIYYKNVMEDESENGLTLTISTIKRVRIYKFANTFVKTI